MMNINRKIFWDIDISELNVELHAQFIIKRVIQRGSLEDWIEIKKLYGLNFIKDEILKIRDLDTKTLSFFSKYFEIDKKKFRCYNTKQFFHQH